MQDNKIRDVSQENLRETSLIYHSICALHMCATCALLVCYTLIFTPFQHTSELLNPL